MRKLLLNEIKRVCKLILIKYNQESLINKLRISIDTPKNESYGDFCTNIAFILSKSMNKSPMEIAKEVYNKIDLPENVLQKVDIVSPGFINFFLSQSITYKTLENILHDDANYGRSSIGQGRSVLIEFVSANPTGPLHIGHGRCAAFGDSLSNLLEMAGYKVIKEYYINDSGRQINILGESVYTRYCQLAGIDMAFPENGYQGDYINNIACDLFKKEGKRYLEIPADNSIKILSDIASQKILKEIMSDLENFGVLFNSWFSETALLKECPLETLIYDLKEKGIIYEKDNALWMRTSILGDEKDRVIIKSNGETTYFASDIVYHQNKIQRGYDRLIDIWGADHHGYVDRIKSIINAFGFPDENISFLLIQMVKLVKNGIQIDMSTRKGTFITLNDLINEVGKDAARFFFLLRRHDSQLDFDIDLAKKQSSENPVYYCQYVHARISSIESKANMADIMKQNAQSNCFNLLELPIELEIIKKLDEYPYLIENAAESLEPHRITFYLIELSALFHRYYNANKVLSLRNKALSIARLSLISAIKLVIKNGLALIGVSAPEKM